MPSAARRLIPLLDRVLVRKADAVSTSKGGIVIPKEAQAKVLRGEVIAVGPGTRNKAGTHIPVGVKVGDYVLLPDYGGTKVDLEDDKEYRLFRESDILAKVE